MPFTEHIFVLWQLKGFSSRFLAVFLQKGSSGRVASIFCQFMQTCRHSYTLVAVSTTFRDPVTYYYFLMIYTSIECMPNYEIGQDRYEHWQRLSSGAVTNGGKLMCKTTNSGKFLTCRCLSLHGSFKSRTLTTTNSGNSINFIIFLN